MKDYEFLKTLKAGDDVFLQSFSYDGEELEPARVKKVLKLHLVVEYRAGENVSEHKYRIDNGSAVGERGYSRYRSNLAEYNDTNQKKRSEQNFFRRAKSRAYELDKMMVNTKLHNLKAEDRAGKLKKLAEHLTEALVLLGELTGSD